MSSEEQLNQAIDKVLAQFPVTSRMDSLGGFTFLLDQVVAVVPQIHPLEVARELYVRIASREVTADSLHAAFTMGGLVALSGRSRTAEFNAKAEAEAAAAFRQIRENWSSYHQRG
jgi:hypothetical protein